MIDLSPSVPGAAISGAPQSLSDPNRRRVEVALCIVGAAVPAVSLLSANALAPLIIIAAIGVAALSAPRALIRNVPTPVIVALAVLLGFGLLSAAWSPLPGQSVRKALQLLPLFAAFCILVAAALSLAPKSRERVGKWLSVGVGAAVLLLLTEAAVGGVLNHVSTGEPLYAADALARYKRGATVTVLLMGPAAYWVWHAGQRFIAFVIVTGMLLGALLAQSGTAVTGAVFGLGVFVVAMRFPLFARRGLAAALALVVLAMPLMRFAPTQFPADLLHVIQSNGMHRLNSAVHRYVIWQFVGERIAERPMLGWGLDSSRAIPGAQASAQGFSEVLPLHPHNAALQLWLELGVPGGLLGAFLAGWAALRVDKVTRSHRARATVLGVVAATAVPALVGFGIWQSWWVAAIGLVAVCALAVLPDRTAPG